MGSSLPENLDIGFHCVCVHCSLWAHVHICYAGHVHTCVYLDRCTLVSVNTHHVYVGVHRS